jgi:hypothetical protein
MLLHLVGIEPYLIDVLNNGPFIPKTPRTGPVLDGAVPGELIDKPVEHWTDDERKLVNLDNKLRGIIISTLPTNIMKTVIKLQTAKLVWDALCIQFEGTEEVRANRKIDLKRSYETFFAKPNESLDDTYNRFKCHLDDMTNADIVIDAYELNHKFLDILPYKWQGLRQILRNNGSLRTHTLQSLFGVFQFEERAAAQVKRAEADSRRNEAITPAVKSSNASSSTSMALVSSETVEIPNYDVNNVDDEATLDSIVKFASSLDTDERNSLLNEFMEFALVAGSKYARKWRRPGSNVKPAGGYDKSQDTCYKCGKKGHYQKECRGSPMVGQKDEEPNFKSKYYKLKAQIATTSEPTDKGFVAEEKDWADSDDSSDDEEITTMCFMATSDETAVNKDQVSNGQWVFVTLKKVTKFSESSADIQQDILESLTCDLQYVEQTKADLVSKLKTAEDTLNNTSSQLKELKDVDKTLETQRYVNTLLSKENNDLVLTNEKLRDEIIDLQKICNSWGRATKIAYDCIEKQVPYQIKAVLDQDFKTAAALSNFKFGSITKNDFEGSASETTADFENDVSSNDELDELIERDLQDMKDRIPIRPMGRVPYPTVFNDYKKKEKVTLDAARFPQPRNLVISKPAFRKQNHLAGTPPPKPAYSKNKSDASLSGKKPIDPIKELTIQMSSLTNQLKQMKENSKQGIGQNTPKRKCYFCGERTHAADDCTSKVRSSPLKVDEAADKSKASSSKVKNSSVSRTSVEEPTTVWVPKKI